MAYLGETIKKLGFGLMRLPKIGEDIDIEQTKAMVDRFLAEGFTYFDTAWAYGGSEDAIRAALVERHPRESYQLATKLAPWINCKSREEAIAQFEESLRRTGAGYFDFYLLHNLGGSRVKFFDDYDLWSFVQEKKAEGLIRHVGFSAHCSPEELDAIITAHPEMEFVQLQINYADWDDKDVQSRRCYEVARKHGLPVIVMEPVKGGMLATPPETVEQLFRAADPTASNASWAIRFAADLDGVITVLSGMSDMAQMEDNLAVMKDFSGLSADQRDMFVKAQKAMAEVPLIPCTSCDYCAKVCPMSIGISGTFAAMNILKLYRNEPRARQELNWKVIGWEKKPAADCIGCGACEEACPQHIAIREELSKAAEALK